MPPQQPSRKSERKELFQRPDPGSVPRPAQALPLEVVDPVWLLKALALAAVAAVICAWLALCLLYYLGSWQLILHPSRSVDRTPASLNLPFTDIQFDASETGQPRLTAWWIPAAASPSSLHPSPDQADAFILYLHDGAGSLTAALPTLGLLHSAGLNLFAVDYRGFGHSDSSTHPTSGTMAADASAALDYLVTTSHIPEAEIVPYGTGLGASLAVSLAHTHPGIRAVILDNPDPDPTATAVAAHPSHVVPIRLLFHEHFEIAGPLAALTTPKLLIAGGPNQRSVPPASQAPGSLAALLRSAASPRFSLDLPGHAPDAAYLEALHRFLDQYLPNTAAPAPPPVR